MTQEELVDLSTTSRRPVDQALLEAILSRQEDVSLKAPGVFAHYYRFLYRLIEKIKPRLCLELGTHTGISSACMADGYPDGKIVTVNNRNELRDECRRPNVEYLIRDSLAEYIPPVPIDILFIDTEHNGIRCLSEYNLYIKHMAPDGIVFFDDIFLNGEMKDFWKNFNPPDGDKFELLVHGWAGFGGILLRPLRLEEGISDENSA